MRTVFWLAFVADGGLLSLTLGTEMDDLGRVANLGDDGEPDDGEMKVRVLPDGLAMTGRMEGALTST